MLSKEEVQHIARLARIGLEEKEIEKFRSDLSAVLDWFAELQKAELSDTPVFDVASRGMRNICREDVSRLRGGDRDRILPLFPRRNGDSLAVKSVF